MSWLPPQDKLLDHTIGRINLSKYYGICLHFHGHQMLRDTSIENQVTDQNCDFVHKTNVQ